MSSTVRGIHPQMGIPSSDSPRSLPSVSSYRPEAHFKDDDETKLLSVSWNQDYGCFAVGTSRGFRIYNSEPFSEALTMDKDMGFGIVEMLFRCNYFALVGGGDNPQYPPKKVMIWDDYQKRFTNELTFRSDVRAVKLRRDRIVVVLERKIYLYNSTRHKLIHEIDTSSNPRGLCCLSHHSDNSILACPGLQQGQVRVEHFSLKKITFISAHDSHIACLTLTLDGLLLATASIKGTLIRIFNTMDGTCLQEVRRGIEKADIYSIAFSPNLQWLAVSSDRSTVHVFNLGVRGVGEDASRQHASGEGPGVIPQNSSTSHAALTSPNSGAKLRSSLSFMKGMLPKYFSSEWSFAQFHLPEATRYTAAFGAQNTVAIVGMDGSFYRCSFDPVKGGEMVKREYIRFLKVQQPPIRHPTP